MALLVILLLIQDALLRLIIHLIIQYIKHDNNYWIIVAMLLFQFILNIYFISKIDRRGIKLTLFVVLEEVCWWTYLNNMGAYCNNEIIFYTALTIEYILVLWGVCTDQYIFSIALWLFYFHWLLLTFFHPEVWEVEDVMYMAAESIHILTTIKASHELLNWWKSSGGSS